MVSFKHLGQLISAEVRGEKVGIDVLLVGCYEILFHLHVSIRFQTTTPRCLWTTVGLNVPLFLSIIRRLLHYQEESIYL